MKNKQITYERTKRTRLKRRKWFDSVKSHYSCTKCGESDACCLDFHHKNSNNKIDTVARLVTSKRPKHIILKEIDKCEAICVNCHRKLHCNPDSTDSKCIQRKKLKENRKCINCNEDYYVCLDFHHINSNKKLFGISRAITNRMKLKDIHKEIKKCIVVCGNCHRKLHAGKLIIQF